jgi:hypothetical protein
MGAGVDDDEASESPEMPRNYWTLARCVEAVRTYLDDPETKGNPSQARYRAWAAGRADAPSPSAFGRYGGWIVVSRLARQRALHAPEPHVPGRNEQREAAVLAYLEQRGRIKNADVQALLNCSEHMARHILERRKQLDLLPNGGERGRLPCRELG